MRKTIDWNKVWNEFNTWFNTQRKPPCKTCGQRNLLDHPEWEDQQDKIQKLVNAQVREIAKKKT